MPCFAPLDGWRSRETTKNGKRKIVFDARLAFRDLPVTVACGKCSGCRLERARQWAVRCMHEASLYPENVFVTLTYKRVPEGGSLRPRDFVLFMKRLRKSRAGGIRFLQSGEYGALGRPHHHALLFNCCFPDSVFFGESSSGEEMFVSEELERLWGKGFCTASDVTFQSAGYVARYTIKKVAEETLQGRRPEYMTMSRREGIGSGWIRKYESDVYPRDEVIVSGKACKPPRFYDDKVGFKRVVAEHDYKEQSSGRLIAKRVCCERKVSDFLKRDL